MLRRRIEKWSLTSLQHRLVKTGGRLLKHARYYRLLLAENHLTQRRFGSILQRREVLSLPAGQALQGGEMNQDTGGDEEASEKSIRDGANPGFLVLANGVSRSTGALTLKQSTKAGKIASGGNGVYIVTGPESKMEIPVKWCYQKKIVGFLQNSPREKLATARFLFLRIRSRLADLCRIPPPHRGNDRTVYVIGLFGSGRLYVNRLILQILGKRAKNFRHGIRFHQGPTSLIYSGHATIKHPCRGQEPPATGNRILESVRSGNARLIFVCRHPLDSLLTNWVWWRTFDSRYGTGEVIASRYKTEDELCVALEQNFPEFQSFADGVHDPFADIGGPRFLSFLEFIEETELYIQAATLVVRFEDLTINPRKELCRIAEVMFIDGNLNGMRIVPARTKPFRYLAVKEKVPQFRNFINELDAETKRRIEKLGYTL